MNTMAQEKSPKRRKAQVFATSMSIAWMVVPFFFALATAQDGIPTDIEAPGSSRGAASERREQESPSEAAASASAGGSQAESSPQGQGPLRLTSHDAEAKLFRGEITDVSETSFTMKTSFGETVQLGLPDCLTVFSLANGSFAEVTFGTYVGSVAERMVGSVNSPAARHSASWLHKGLELRIIDEQLRGVELGHKNWDLTPESTITHGWVDDIEDRVLSIKYGPTGREETDVEIPYDVPILKMSVGDRELIRAGSRALAGVIQGHDGRYVAQFIFLGQEGIVPPL